MLFLYKSARIIWTLSSVRKSRKAVDVVPQRKINGKMGVIWNSNDKQTRAIINTMAKYGFDRELTGEQRPQMQSMFRENL